MTGFERPQPRIAAAPAAPRRCQCSFCGRAQGEVFWLLAGLNVFICDECVDDATAQIAKIRAEQAPSPGEEI